jgi:hypothetical protein
VSQNDQQSTVTSDDLANEIIGNSTLTICLPANNVMVSEDKLEICLKDYHADVKSRDAWITPACIALSILLTLTTSKFKDALVPASTWQAFFLMGLVVDVIWLLSSIGWRKKHPEIKEIITALKQGGKTRSITNQPGQLQINVPPFTSPSTNIVPILNGNPQCSKCGVQLVRISGQQICANCGQIN